MSGQFFNLIKELYLALSLPEPDEINSVSSFQVGNQLCHVTEHPVDYMLMFVTVVPVLGALAAEQNIFSQDPCRPVLGLDPVSQSQVLWSRQSMAYMDRALIHHQLEQLVFAADKLMGVRID